MTNSWTVESLEPRVVLSIVPYVFVPTNQLADLPPEVESLEHLVGASEDGRFYWSLNTTEPFRYRFEWSDDLDLGYIIDRGVYRPVSTIPELADAGIQEINSLGVVLAKDAVGENEGEWFLYDLVNPAGRRYLREDFAEILVGEFTPVGMTDDTRVIIELVSDTGRLDVWTLGNSESRFLWSNNSFNSGVVSYTSRGYILSGFYPQDASGASYPYLIAAPDGSISSPPELQQSVNKDYVFLNNHGMLWVYLQTPYLSPQRADAFDDAGRALSPSNNNPYIGYVFTSFLFPYQYFEGFTLYDIPGIPEFTNSAQRNTFAASSMTGSGIVPVLTADASSTLLLERGTDPSEHGIVRPMRIDEFLNGAGLAGFEVVPNAEGHAIVGVSSRGDVILAQFNPSGYLARLQIGSDAIDPVDAVEIAAWSDASGRNVSFVIRDTLSGLPVAAWEGGFDITLRPRDGVLNGFASGPVLVFEHGQWPEMLVGLNADGDVMTNYHPDLDDLTTWAQLNLIENAMSGPNAPSSVPALMPTSVYETPWGGRTIVAHDGSEIWAIWWSPGLSHWQISNLSAIAPTGEIRIEAGIEAISNPWGGVNIFVQDTDGNTRVLWWSPALGPGNWQFSDLTAIVEGGGSTGYMLNRMVAFATPWNGMNIVGHDESGDLVAYWWAPGMERWETSNLTQAAANSTHIPVGFFDPVVTTEGVIRLIGADTNGILSELYWSGASGQWTSRSLG